MFWLNSVIIIILFSFKVVLATLAPLYFHLNFRMFATYIPKKMILLGVWLGLLWIYTMINKELTYLQYWIFWITHLFISLISATFCCSHCTGFHMLDLSLSISYSYVVTFKIFWFLLLELSNTIDFYILIMQP